MGLYLVLKIHIIFKNMNTSETIEKIAAALVAFQGEMPTVSFDAKNPFLKNKYASLTQLVTVAKPYLLKHGLAVTQLINGSQVVTMLLHASGQYISSTTDLHIDAGKGLSSSQVAGVAITYARRYAYASILGLVADEDNDGHTGETPAAPPILKAPADILVDISKANTEKHLSNIWGKYAQYQKDKAFVDAVRNRKAELLKKS
jgi:hypothetical protein